MMELSSADRCSIIIGCFLSVMGMEMGWGGYEPSQNQTLFALSSVWMKNSSVQICQAKNKYGLSLIQMKIIMFKFSSSLCFELVTRIQIDETMLFYLIINKTMSS